MADTKLKAVATVEHRTRIASAVAPNIRPTHVAVGHCSDVQASRFVLAFLRRKGRRLQLSAAAEGVTAFARSLHPLLPVSMSVSMRLLMHVPASTTGRPTSRRCDIALRFGVTRRLCRRRPSGSIASAPHGATILQAQTLSCSGTDRVRMLVRR